jgi:hypothetical protein
MPLEVFIFSKRIVIIKYNSNTTNYNRFFLWSIPVYSDIYCSLMCHKGRWENKLFINTIKTNFFLVFRFTNF